MRREPKTAVPVGRPARRNRTIDAVAFWAAAALCRIQSDTCANYRAQHRTGDQTDMFTSVFVASPRA